MQVHRDITVIDGEIPIKTVRRIHAERGAAMGTEVMIWKKLFIQR